MVIREYEQLFTDDRRVETVKVRFPGTNESEGGKHLPPHTETVQVTFAPGRACRPYPASGPDGFRRNYRALAAAEQLVVGVKG
jgi:hypothetical protein